MGMVTPRAIQVYHSFLAQGSPHCMVVVKMWPYLGKKGEKWRRVMCTCFFIIINIFFSFLLLFIVRLLPSHSYAILVMLSRLASRCGEALRSVAYLLHVACVPRTCSLGWCYYTWTMFHIYAALSLSPWAILTVRGGLAGLCLGAIVRHRFVLCLSCARH